MVAEPCAPARDYRQFYFQCESPLLFSRALLALLRQHAMEDAGQEILATACVLGLLDKELEAIYQAWSGLGRGGTEDSATAAEGGDDA